MVQPLQIESTDVPYRGSASALMLRIYRPRTLVDRTAVVLFHGGGFVAGGLDSIAPLASAMAARLETHVVTPMYTAATERPFPAAAEDAYAAIMWTANHAHCAGWDADSLV